MEIIKTSEAFKRVDGTFQFQYVHGIVQHDGCMYIAKWKDRRQVPCDFSKLYDVKPLVTEGRGPRLLPSWTVVQGHECYVKTPDLWAFAQGSELEDRIQREVEVCELLKQNPHPNIARYRGCLVRAERVSGICFQRYTSTLLEKVNPGGLNKNEFLSSGRALIDDNTRAGVSGILSGIRHLHSLGIIHNDITPSNIMLDENGTLVLIDFDSCRKVGESLQDTRTKRTHGWHDPTVAVAQEQNDLDAFQELLKWLFGASAKQYLFP